MATRVQDFQAPEVQPDQKQEAQYADEWSDRFGILVGGVKETFWNGIGENAVGHYVITRRVWMPFTRLRVGRRPEFEGALDLSENATQLDWATNPDRLSNKSPRACAGDVLAAFRAQGYCVPTILIGHRSPQAVCEKVWPREVRDGFRLIDHIEYFEAFQSDNEEEATLASQLLEACYMSRSYIQEYVRAIKTEMENKQGLKSLNEALKELFHEIGEPLPEHRSALVAQEMGREIVKAGQNDGRKDDAIVNVLGKIADRLDRLEAKEPQKVQGSNPETSEASDTQTSNTQTRRGLKPAKE